MIVEGRNAVRETLKSGKTIEKLIIQKGNRDGATGEIVALAKKAGVKILYQEKELMDKQSPSGRHQGVMCYKTDFVYSEVEDIIQVAKDRGEELFIVILDGISDPHNLGSIIRTAECAGVHGIVIPKHRACGVNDTVIKISEGASEYVKIAMVTNINDTIRQLKDEYFVNVIAADMDGKVCYDVDLKVPLALVIGGEGDGVKRLTKSLCDYSIAIPMKGKINSLNASVAAAVSFYEIVRQRLTL